jgi:hypothetical protein
MACSSLATTSWRVARKVPPDRSARVPKKPRTRPQRARRHHRDRRVSPGGDREGHRYGQTVDQALTTHTWDMAGPSRPPTGRNRSPRPVRAGSATDGQTTDNSGQERYPNVSQTRRSLHLQPSDLVGRRRATWSSSLPTHHLARASPQARVADELRAPAHRRPRLHSVGASPGTSSPPTASGRSHRRLG